MTDNHSLAIVALTPGGAALARRLGSELPHAVIWLPEDLRQADGCRYFSGGAAELLPWLFSAARELVCIMATGIVVRILAPHLRSKAVDPAVVVLDEAGEFAISLLSGHLGGANRLARDLARLTGGQGVITTATDVQGITAWDEAAWRAGLAIEPLAHLARLNALLLRGEKIVLVDRRRRVADDYAEVPGVEPVATFAAAVRANAAGAVFVTHRHIPHLAEQDSLLVLRPRDLVVGIGCNRGTSADEIEEAVKVELQQAFLSPLSIAALATIAEKRDEAGITECARRFAVPVDYHSAAALNSIPIPGAPSRHALAAVGAQGVCEPAALLSAAGGSLLVKKRKRGNVTVAVAEKS